jgi:membrane-bound lytic murein transglycosylase D
MKYILLLSLAFTVAILITASDPFFGIELSLKQVPKEEIDDVREKTWMSSESFRPFLKDKDDKVSDLFPVTKFYYPNVHFWFLIYTQFDSSSLVIHDKSNLSIIYKVLDFSGLKKKKLSKNTLYVLQQKISKERLNDLKKDFDLLINDPFSSSPQAKKMYRILKNSGVDLPVKRGERITKFKNLKNNLRGQTGQKNFIRDGIIRSLPYEHFLANYFENKKLPKELLAIPFLESSFNPKAESKANALGIWQFMPLISSYYVPRKKDNFDYRFNIGVASIAAANLMSENFTILKSWDLAVTAYNSGTKHLLKTKRELGRPVTLEDVISHSNSKHFGFASKNFYSEFLALVHTLAYREELFDNLHKSDRRDNDKDLRFYLTKCSLNLGKELSPEQLEDILFHNHHTEESSLRVQKGFILTAKGHLKHSTFYEIPTRELLRSKPKEWSRLVTRYNCSTR